MILRREDPFARVIVPDHKALRPGTLRQILHEAGLGVDELLRLL
jgi:predicted RNA binding protein YcfA (HicA-like mRNA interferase family)